MSSDIQITKTHSGKTNHTEAEQFDELHREQSIVNYGVSEQLKSEFDLLRDLRSDNGQHKFTSRTVDTLAQHLVCRHYSNLCYEFAHINWALVFLNANTHSARSTGSIQHALLDFYWITQCQSSSRFARYFDHIVNVGEPQTTSSISVEYAGGANSGSMPSSQNPRAAIVINIYEHRFTISASRANLLACFMEWLICIIPNLLGLIESTLLGQGHNAIREFSSVLQKHIYNYLKDHLPAAKLQSRYRLMQSFYKAQADTQQSTLNDETVLKFWQLHNKEEGYGKFSSVVRDSLSYQKALDITQTGTKLQYAESISETDQSSHFSDENDSAEMFQLLSQTGHYLIDASVLLEAPKALNKSSFELIELAANYPQYIVPLSISWLRVNVFGKAQNQIIQFARMKKLTQNKSDDFSVLVEQDYKEIVHTSIKLMANNQQTLLAIVHLLLSEKPKQACLILLKLMNGLPLYEKHIDAFSQMLNNENMKHDSLGQATLATWQLSHPWFKSLIVESSKAFKHINRQGFTEKTRLNPHQYVSTAEILFDLNKLIKQLLRHINQNNSHTVSNFEADRFIFLNEFSSLYSRDDK
jgi:hypothetical protein